MGGSALWGPSLGAVGSRQATGCPETLQEGCGCCCGDPPLPTGPLTEAEGNEGLRAGRGPHRAAIPSAGRLPEPSGRSVSPGAFCLRALWPEGLRSRRRGPGPSSGGDLAPAPAGSAAPAPRGCRSPAVPQPGPATARGRARRVRAAPGRAPNMRRRPLPPLPGS